MIISLLGPLLGSFFRCTSLCFCLLLAAPGAWGPFVARFDSGQPEPKLATPTLGGGGGGLVSSEGEADAKLGGEAESPLPEAPLAESPLPECLLPGSWPQASAQSSQDHGTPHSGAGRVEADLYHPDHQPGPDGTRPALPAPRRGGRVIVHLRDRPGSWNRMVDNTGVVAFVHAEIHESLLRRNPESFEFESLLAREWVVEDRLRIRAEAGGERELFGQVEEEEDGVTLTPRSPGNPLEAPQHFSADQVRSVERAVVHTFRLRDDVLWHDGQPFDAKDVYFSWLMYSNPTVDCDHDREEITTLYKATLVDDLTIRFEGREQYFGYPQSLSNLCLVPAHLYDLSDPDNEQFEPGIDPLGERQGRFVNEHPNNRMFVGLGPYRMVAVDDEKVDAVRFDHYFDPDPSHGNAGWLDAIRWRIIPDRAAGQTALLEGELDYFEGLTSSDYFGAFTHQDAFTKRLYAAYAYRPAMQYIAWNMRRPQLRDVRVRRALGHACDWDAFLKGQAHGLGIRITGTAYHEHPAYDKSIKPLSFDQDLARDLLDEAGWYDRDGDGLRDKDGLPLRIEFMTYAGGGISKLYAQVLQEGLAQIGVEVDVVPLDPATLYERLRAKDFDAVARAWLLDVENDPIQVWGRWKGDPDEDRTTNYPGWGDDESQALIEEIRRTVDDQVRWSLTRKLQRRIFDDQPYLFLFDFPVKFAVAKKIRGFKAYALQPGYSLRDWYLVDE